VSFTGAPSSVTFDARVERNRTAAYLRRDLAAGAANQGTQPGEHFLEPERLGDRESEVEDHRVVLFGPDQEVGVRAVSRSIDRVGRCLEGRRHLLAQP
jgi:hypothetical protein